jgi:hypothetical protein
MGKLTGGWMVGRIVKWIYAYEYGLVGGLVNKKINKLMFEEVNRCMKRWII